MFRRNYVGFLVVIFLLGFSANTFGQTKKARKARSTQTSSKVRKTKTNSATEKTAVINSPKDSSSGLPTGKKQSDRTHPVGNDESLSVTKNKNNTNGKVNGIKDGTSNTIGKDTQDSNERSKGETQLGDIVVLKKQGALLDPSTPKLQESESKTQNSPTNILPYVEQGNATKSDDKTPDQAAKPKAEEPAVKPKRQTRRTKRRHN